MSSSGIKLTIAALLAQSGVTAVTSTRVKPFELPLGTLLPAIVVTMNAETEEYTLAGASQYPQTSVQVHCIAETASVAVELGERVKEALRDLLYTSSDSPPFKASFQKEDIDFPSIPEDHSTYSRVMGFTVRWR